MHISLALSAYVATVVRLSASFSTGISDGVLYLVCARIRNGWVADIYPICSLYGAD